MIEFNWSKHLPHYLDYMASTPLDPRVAEKMTTFSMNFPGNPSSISHSYGWHAKEQIALASEQLAALINAKADEVIWTSGATESINMALKGAAYAYRRQGNHIITLATEHKATLETVKALESDGFKVTLLPVKQDGIVDLEQLTQAITSRTILLSICHVNNEIGVIQPIADIAKIAHEKGCLIHIDGAQTLGKTSIDFGNWNIDFLSLSGHKVYAPQGIGALIVKQQPQRQLMPLMHGGTQQKYRAGTLPAHLIVAMGYACQLIAEEWQDHFTMIETWQKKILQAFAQLGNITIHGSLEQRVPHNLNIHVGGIDGEALLYALDKMAISSGSACNAANPQPSHVIQALGYTRHHAQQALRISLGKFCNDDIINAVIMHMTEVIADLRRLSPQ